MRYGNAVLGTLLTGLPLLAWAGDGWVITDQGEKPDREIVVVRDETIENRTRESDFLAQASRQDKKAYEKWRRDKQRNPASNAPAPPYVGPELEYELRTEATYENPGKQMSVFTTYRVNCTRGRLDVPLTMTFWRNKAADKSENLPAHEPANALERRVMDFACNGGGDAIGEPRSNALVARGFAHLSDVGSNASDFVWAKVWKAKEPAFSREVMLANMERSVSALGKTVEKTQETVRDASRRMQRFQEDSARTKNRVGRSTTLEMWIDRNESDFVRRFGAPDQFYDSADGIRTLSYHKAETSMSTSVRPIGMTASGAPIMQPETSQQTSWCDFSVQVRDGKIFDYAVTAGNACPDILND